MDRIEPSRMVSNIKNNSEEIEFLFKESIESKKSRLPQRRSVQARIRRAINRRKKYNFRRKNSSRKKNSSVLTYSEAKSDPEDGHSIPKIPAKNDLNKVKILSFSSPPTLFAAHNCLTLHSNHKLFELVAFCAHRKIEVLAVSEHRRFFTTDPDNKNDIRKFDLGDGWKFYFSTCELNSMLTPIGGVGFILSPKASKALLSITTINSRILKCQLSSSSNLLCILFSVYSPTSTADINTVTDFYDNLTDEVNNISIRNFFLILGDFNAQLITSKNILFTSENIENRRLNIKSSGKKLNRNSDNLKEFLDTLDIIPVNSRFCKPHHQLVTHKRPQGHRVTLDHILIPRKWLSSAIDCKAIPSPISSDHAVLLAKFKWRLKVHNIQQKRKPIYDWRALPSDNYLSLTSDLSKFQPDTNLTTHQNYESFISNIQSSINRNVPTVSHSRKLVYWQTPDIVQLRAKKLSLLQSFRASVTESKRNLYFQQYSTISHELSDLYKKTQQDYFSSQCDKINILHGSHKHSEAWKLINSLTGRNCRKKGILSVNSPTEGTQIFHRHFQKLLQPTLSPSPDSPPIDFLFGHNFSPTTPLNTNNFTQEEIEIGISQLAKNKATGIDSIPAEVLHNTILVPNLCTFFNYVLTSGIAFSDWKLSLIIPVPKKGDLSIPDNYRGIALMSIVAKLYNRCLLNRLKISLDPLLRTSQNGFRTNRSTTQHILALKRIIEESQTHKDTNLIAVFIDFSKAFDSVFWSQLEAILIAYSVPPLLVNAIMALYKGAQAQVSTQYGPSEELINLKVGVLQGDTLAPYLFIIVIDYILRKALNDLENQPNPVRPGFKLSNSTSNSHNLDFSSHSYRTRNTTGSRSSKFITESNSLHNITDLDFADDLTLLASTFADAQCFLSMVETIALTVGLKINRKKTVYLVAGNPTPTTGLFLCDSPTPIEQVSDFKFLGSYLINTKSDIQYRITLAWSAARKLGRIWHNPTIENTYKLNIFRATIESILLYAAETWVLTTTLEKKLDSAYNRLYRYALNINWKDKITNAQLFATFQPLSVRLRFRRLQFAGHCFRSISTAPQPVSELLFWSPQSKFIIGKGSQLTFRDLIFKDLSMPNDDINLDQIKSWMSDRNIWRKKINNIAKADHKRYLELQPILQEERKIYTIYNTQRLRNLKISACFAILKFRCFTSINSRRTRNQLKVPSYLTVDSRLPHLSKLEKSILNKSGWKPRFAASPTIPRITILRRNPPSSSQTKTPTSKPHS